MRVQVAVGILVNGNQKLLIQQRRTGTDCAGKWEFPGGKIESGETPATALKRELTEELAIDMGKARPLINLKHDYAHANVSLHSFIIYDWKGEAQGHEGQAIVWVTPDEAESYDLLEAAYPLLAQARLRLK